MKLEIMKKVDSKVIVDIDFPFYYKYDLMPDDRDSVIFGKIEEDGHTSIHITHDCRTGTKSFEFEIEKGPAARWSCWITDGTASDAGEFEKARDEMLAAMGITPPPPVTAQSPPPTPGLSSQPPGSPELPLGHHSKP